MNKVTLILFVSTLLAAPLSAKDSDVLPPLRPVVSQVTQEFSQIPAERQKALKKVALFIRSKIQAKEDPQLTFICTHNSRRSHLSQIWAQTAAVYYDVPGIRTFSGGTEATACNERTVAALKRAGFDITNSTPGLKNPVYLVRYGTAAEPLGIGSTAPVRRYRATSGARSATTDRNSRCSPARRSSAPSSGRSAPAPVSKTVWTSADFMVRPPGRREPARQRRR